MLRLGLSKITVVAVILSFLAAGPGWGFQGSGGFLGGGSDGLVAERLFALDWDGAEGYVGFRRSPSGNFGPMSLAVDEGAGEIYILDSVNGRIQVFSMAGDLLRAVNVDHGADDFILRYDGDFAVLFGARQLVICYAHSGGTCGEFSVPLDSSPITKIWQDIEGGLSVIRSDGTSLPIHYSDRNSRVLGWEVNFSTVTRGVREAGRVVVSERLSSDRGSLSVSDSNGAVFNKIEIFPLLTNGRLETIEYLGSDKRGDVFVLVEESVPASVVVRSLRKYDANSALIAAEDVPSSSFTYVRRDIVVAPSGCAYQLLSLADEAVVLRWCSGARGEQGWAPPINSYVHIESGVPLPGEVQPRHEVAFSTDGANLAAVSQQEVLSRAQAYASYKFKPRASNLTPLGGIYCQSKIIETPDWLVVDQFNVGVPYQWGGTSGLRGITSVTGPKEDFDAGLALPKFAGDICTSVDPSCRGNKIGDSRCAVGVDCSGFISRVWGLVSRHGTGQLPEAACRLPSVDDVLPGDILIINTTDVGHVKLFAGREPDGKFKIFESVALHWKVVQSSSSRAELAAYVPYRSTAIVGMFNIGDRVQALASMNVRPCAGLSCLPSKGIEPQGGLGTITGNSQFKDGYLWWEVEWDSGLSGWTYQCYVHKSGGSGETPAKPDSLNATAISSGQIKVTWSDRSSNETDFRLLRRDGSEGEWRLRIRLQANSTTFSDSGLLAGGVYFYKVRACRGEKCSAFSEEASARTPADRKPPAPKGLIASADKNGVTLGWQDASGLEERFEVERRTGTQQWRLLASVGANTLSLRDDKVAASTRYFYRVRACNSAGCSNYSPEASAQTPASLLPVISSVSPDPIGEASHVQRITIYGLNFASGATVRLKDLTHGGTFTKSVTYVSSSEIQISERFSSAGRWSVQVVNPNGSVSNAFDVEVRSTGIPPIPSGATPGSTSSPGPTMGSATVTMSWNASNGATTYSIGVRDIVADRLIVDTSTASTSYTFRFSAGGRYRWNVAACNNAGCSSFTTPLYFQAPSEGSAPSVPTNPNPGSTSSPGPIMGSATVTMSWNGSGSTTRYTIGVRDMASNQQVVDTTTTSTSYTVNLNAGGRYRWNVAACNTSGCSSFTVPLYFQTSGGNSVPSVPTSLNPGSTNSPGPTMEGTTVTMSWSGSSGATSYRIGVRDMISNQLIVDTATGSTSYTVNFSAGGRYRWNVAACNSSGCSSFTAPLYFQVPGGGAIPSTPVDPGPGSTNSPGPITTSTTVTMGWNASSGATSYSLGVRDMVTNQLVVDTTTNDPFYTVSFGGGGRYRWNVAACNSAGCSSFTTPLYFQTPGGAAVPSAPTNTSPGSTSSPGPITGSSIVTISWSASSGATSYSLGVRDMTTNQLVVDTITSDTSYTANLSAGGQYRWNVAACNSVGCSSFTTPLYFQTPGGSTVPSTPINTIPGSASSPGPTMGSSTVTMSWSASSGATSYSFGVRDMSTNQLVVDTTTSDTFYTANLSAGGQYRWNVAACNSAGCSSFTTPLYFQTPGGSTVPPTPTNTIPGSASSPGPTMGSSTVTMSWSVSNGAASYSFGVRDMNTNQLVVDTTTSDTSYTASLSAGGQYRWNVAACNSTGCSSFTTPLYFQAPGGVTVPLTPTNASPGSTSSPGPTMSSSTVTMSWSASSGATSYSFGVRDMNTDQLVVDTATSGASYTVNLSAGGKYRWNVAACNSAGCSSFTTPLYFQTPGGVTVPSTPSNTSPGSTSSPGPTMGSSTVTMSWSASNGATNYSFGVRDMNTNQLVVDTSTSGTSYTVNLSAGGQYRWNVAACNSAGCSSFSTPLYFRTPGGVTVPSTPGNTSPGSTSSPGPTTGSSTVTMSWSASSGATSYSFGVRDMNTNQLVVDTSTSGTSYTVNLSAGGQYRWNVAACNSAGCSSFTTPLYFRTPGGVTVPSTPTSTSPGSTSSPGPTMGSSTVTMSWSSSSGATSYSFGVRDMTTNQLVVDTTTSSTFYTANLIAGRRYRWNVAACNSAGCSSFTTPLYFQTP